MKRLRFVVALVVLATLAAGGWLFVAEPFRITGELREIHAATPDLSERVRQQAERAARVSTALSELRGHAEIVDRFDRWRESEITALGQTLRPWDVVRRRSDVIAAADVGVDAIVSVLANADETLMSLETSTTTADAFSARWDAAQAGWLGRADIHELREDASRVRSDLLAVHTQLRPAADALRTSLAAWRDVEDTLRDTSAIPGLGVAEAAARSAFESLDGAVRTPASDFVEAVDALGAEVDAIGQIIDTTSTLTALPAWFPTSVATQ